MIALRLEVVQVPVADVDRARAFYDERVGFAVDHDGNEWAVQELP